MRSTQCFVRSQCFVHMTCSLQNVSYRFLVFMLLCVRLNTEPVFLFWCLSFENWESKLTESGKENGPKVGFAPERQDNCCWGPINISIGHMSCSLRNVSYRFLVFMFLCVRLNTKPVFLFWFQSCENWESKLTESGVYFWTPGQLLLRPYW